MRLATKCIQQGALPYENIESATRMVAKLFEKVPSLLLLPRVFEGDTLVNRTLSKFPGVEFVNNDIVLNVSSSNYKKHLSKLEKAFNHPKLENLEYFSISSPFMEKFLQMIKKFNSQNAVVSLLGPFTISQMLMNVADEQMLTDKSFRKLFIQGVCVKALWVIEKIKAVNPNTVPIIIFEEPALGQLGLLKRQNEDITIDLVTALFTRVVEKIKEHGAIVGIQCLGKCDWTVPINAGVDIISYDAYNNPNNLCIIPEAVEEFLRRGGMINWGIVPVASEQVIKSLTIDSLSRRFFATLQGVINAGVSAELLYSSALVSIQGSVDNLPIIFAEKAVILSTQLAKKIPVVVIN